MTDRPPPSFSKFCSHGKLLIEDCLACAMVWRIDERKDAEIARLRARVAELEAKT